METQTKTSGGAKDFFINLGAVIALYTLVGSLISLLFTVINKAYPQIPTSYNYYSSASISWPVSILIVFFPIFILFMWLLEKDFSIYPEKQNSGIHKWIVYITLFISGAVIAGDLITVLYYFIDGQELTTGFLLKICVLLVIASGVFSYYIYDILGQLNSQKRKIYRIVSLAIIVLSIVWGFSVLGSPRTQQLFKYDEQKVNEIGNIHNEIQNFYSKNGFLPVSLDELVAQSYYITIVDSQTQEPYEYKKINDTSYNICAEFNKASQSTDELNYRYQYPYGVSWKHPEGRHCFSQNINLNTYYKPVPAL